MKSRSANPDMNVYDITKKCDGALCYDFTGESRGCPADLLLLFFALGLPGCTQGGILGV